MKNIEVEIKFPLLEHGELIKKLNLIAELDKKEEFQKDIYYSPKHKNFLNKKPVSEWLRLRETEKGFSLNYKNWYNDKGNETVYCDEFQTKINDGEALKKILRRLDFEEIVIVEKSRSSWIYKNAEISIDKVKELGLFIEIESKGNFINVEDAKKHLYEVLDELNVEVGEQDFEGYPYLLLKNKGLV